MSDLEKRLRNNEYFPKTARKEDWLEAAAALAAKDARIAELEKALRKIVEDARDIEEAGFIAIDALKVEFAHLMRRPRRPA